ncbi:MAG: hypothetical protein V3V92_02825 [Candidatus Hydrothermarchaeales archaeon]
MTESLRSNEFLRFALGIFLIGVATLGYEIALAYEFSFIFWFNVSFAVISIAMFGLGMGSVVGYFISPDTRESFGKLLYYSSIAFGITIILALSLIAYGSKNFYYGTSFKTMAFFSIVSAVPFIFSGICLSVGLNYPSLDKRVISFIYFSDLVGAAIGSFIITFLLPFSSLEKIVILYGFMAITISPLFLERIEKRALLPVLIPLFLVGIFLTNYQSYASVFVPEAGSDKLLSVLKENGAEILATQWTSVSRVDVVDEIDNKPIRFIVNGHFPVSAFKADGFSHWVEADPRFIGFSFNPKNVLVIGSGGGLELAMGQYVKATKIVGVEIVPFIVKFAKNDLHEYSDSIYSQPGIEAVIEDGRTYVNRANDDYDLIQNGVLGNNGIVVPTSTLLNFQDAYVYTKEANRDYWQHLSPNGVAVTVIHARLDDYNTVDLEKGVTYYTLRQYFTVKEALMEEGVDFKKHVMILRLLQVPPAPGIRSGIQAEYTLMFREELTHEKVKDVLEKATKLNMEPLVAPYIEDSLNLEKMASSLPNWRDVRAITDDKPFFYHTETGPPKILFIMLKLLALMTTVFIILPIVALKGFNFKYKSTSVFLLYFFCLGLGYILIQAVTIQKLTLFLGRPAYAFQVVLFSMLVFSGFGSFLTGTINVPGDKLYKLTMGALGATTLLLTIYTFILPQFIYRFMSNDILVKVLLSILFIAPIAFFMGTPFPLGLRIISHLDQKNVIWMYGVNGSGSVIGSLVGTILAFSYGFSYSFLAGMGIYFLALLSIGGAAYLKKNSG